MIVVVLTASDDRNSEVGNLLAIPILLLLVGYNRQERVTGATHSSSSSTREADALQETNKDRRGMLVARESYWINSINQSITVCVSERVNK